MTNCGSSSSRRRTSSKLRPNPTLNGLSGPVNSLFPYCASSNGEYLTSLLFPWECAAMIDGGVLELKTSNGVGMKTRGKT